MDWRGVKELMLYTSTSPKPLIRLKLVSCYTNFVIVRCWVKLAAGWEHFLIQQTGNRQLWWREDCPHFPLLSLECHREQYWAQYCS